MRIACVDIRDFRGIKEGRVCLQDHTVLIGANQSGKSTIIDALALALGRERMVRQLTEHDFHGSDPSPEQRISIIVTIAGFPENDPQSNEDWFREGRAVPKWWDSATKIVTAAQRGQGQELCAQIGFSARFDRESLSVETMRYFVDDTADDPFDNAAVPPIPGRLIGKLGFFVVPASRTWERTISFGSELFRRVATELPSDLLLKERDRLRSDPQSFLDDASKAIAKQLELLFPSGLSLQLRLTNTDTESILQAMVPHFQKPGEPAIPVGRHGTGLLSLQSVVLLLELGQARKAKGQGLILAVEEPEIHIPPGLQSRVVRQIQALAPQSIATTHSPNVAACYAPTDTLLLQKSNGMLAARQLLTEKLQDSATNAVRKMFLDYRYEVAAALMFEHVLIPEGRTDFEWLRLLVSCTETRGLPGPAQKEAPFGALVGVIPTHSAAVKETFETLGRIRDGLVVLVDGDKPGNDYIESLLQLSTKPKAIVQWPAGQTIEDIITWILEANPSAINESCALLGLASGGTRDDVTRLLRQENGGFKGNYLVYQDIVAIIGSRGECLERAEQVLNEIKSVAVDPNGKHPAFSLHRKDSQTCRVLAWSL